ncbi:hypothetical protein PoB_007302500 [Plakobranchus ocellatus]|uniref:ANK_REP_REGION domain-containing protein n=1 Tax=Plakobranchus ocellatus TaxID=259542 RepID=A0AAV4DRH0_9GAST|nr:hypothetical protein PoB_007302500 [Plakobranchus ocellatus]
MKTSSRRHIGIVHLLLQHKAAVNIKGNTGKTALLLAKSQGHHEIKQLLQEHGAEEESCSRTDMTSSPSNDFTAPGGSETHTAQKSEDLVSVEESLNVSSPASPRDIHLQIDAIRRRTEEWVRKMVGEFKSMQITIIMPVNINVNRPGNVAIGDILIIHNHPEVEEAHGGSDEAGASEQESDGD